MFEKLLAELEALGGTQKIPVPIVSDKDGYQDRECPNKECLFRFKVNEDDWKNIFKDEKVFCPMCRHEAEATSWWTTEQLEHAKEQAFKHIKGRIGQAMIEDARHFNYKQSTNSFLQLTVKISGTDPYHYIMPIPALEEMTLKITCKECQARYAVIGSAFFCPACGHNSAEETFDSSMEKIDAKIKNLAIIRKAVSDVNKDQAELTVRSLIESSLSECVVAFQRFSDVTFSKKMPNEKIKFNAFQNLEVGGDYWKTLFGESYIDWLTTDEYHELNELFQKRHLLSHTEGIVDEKYLNKSGDKNYMIGQRIVINENDVLTLKKLIQRIVENIRSK